MRRGAGWQEKDPSLASSSTKLPDSRKKVTQKKLEHDEGLYRHVKKPEWGVAILAWEKDDRRAYQFEDGRLRKFKEGYYSLMKPAEHKERSDEAVINGLEGAIEANKGKDPPKALEPVASFDAQIELFIEMYPEGFQDEKWIADHRGDTPGRALKRHRDPVVQEIQERLSEERCEELISGGKHSELVEISNEILAGTDLVALKHVKALRRLEEDEEKPLAEAIAEMLHGEGDFDPRYEAYLEVMKDIYDGWPSWRIATALPALMYPEEHVCVRRSAFARQAAVIAPMARYSRRARTRSYKNYRRVAFAVMQRLQAAGHEPRDLLDIHDFVWATLRNAALDHLTDD